MSYWCLAVSRRLVVRYECKDTNVIHFAILGCIVIRLRQFCHHFW